MSKTFSAYTHRVWWGKPYLYLKEKHYSEFWFLWLFVTKIFFFHFVRYLRSIYLFNIYDFCISWLLWVLLLIVHAQITDYFLRFCLQYILECFKQVRNALSIAIKNRHSECPFQKPFRKEYLCRKKSFIRADDFSNKLYTCQKFIFALKHEWKAHFTKKKIIKN